MGIFKSKKKSRYEGETEQEKQERYKEYGCVIQDRNGNKIEFKPVGQVDISLINSVSKEKTNVSKAN